MGNVLAATSLIVAQITTACFGLGVSREAVVALPFAPIGRWAGHWGVDIASPPDAVVRAIASGVVRFSGVVVANRTVSIDHGGGIVTSYSYLATVTVRRGDRVGRGEMVGTSGIHNGRDAFHLSVRVGGIYVDPMEVSRCSRSPAPGLYLVSGNRTYAVQRARDTRRYLRSASQRSPRDRSGGIRPVEPRRRVPHAGRRPVAEG